MSHQSEFKLMPRVPTAAMLAAIPCATELVSARDTYDLLFSMLSSPTGTGSRAFPRTPVQAPDGTLSNGQRGMTLLDYFMAHAPAEPQAWFRPVMPPRPASPMEPGGITPERRDILWDWKDGGLEIEHIANPEDRAHAHALVAYRSVAAQRDREFERQRYVQWPYAWAAEQVRIRAAMSGVPE